MKELVKNILLGLGALVMLGIGVSYICWTLYEAFKGAGLILIPIILGIVGIACANSSKEKKER